MSQRGRHLEFARVKEPSRNGFLGRGETRCGVRHFVAGAPTGGDRSDSQEHELSTQYTKQFLPTRTIDPASTKGDISGRIHVEPRLCAEPVAVGMSTGKAPRSAEIIGILQRRRVPSTTDAFEKRHTSEQSLRRFSTTGSRRRNGSSVFIWSYEARSNQRIVLLIAHDINPNQWRSALNRNLISNPLTRKQ